MPTRCNNVSNLFYFGMTLYMFRTVFPSIIRSSRLYIQQPNRYCCLVEEWKTNLMSLAILFHFLCAQHVSDINISITRSLRLYWWITTSVKTTDVIHQHSRKLLMMDILMSETCWAHKKWNKIASDIKMVFHSSTITMMHGPINIRFTAVCLLASRQQYLFDKCLLLYVQSCTPDDGSKDRPKHVECHSKIK